MISISIVSFNTITDLTRCVDSVLHYTTIGGYEILINAFNYSEENRAILDKLYSSKPEINIIYESGIRGYSANHNLNISRAKNNLICILNDDTYIKQDIIQEFYKILQLDDVGACTPIFYNFDGSVQYIYRKKLTPLWYLFQVVKLNYLFPYFSVYESKNKLSELIKSESIEINYFLGICVCLKRNALPSGLLDETFFLGPDDLYWSYLIRQNKQFNKIILLTRVKVYHKGHTSISRHFPAALPTQIKGMLELFKKMGFRFQYLFNLVLFPFIVLHYWFHCIKYLFIKHEKSLQLKQGYYNVIKIYFRDSSTTAIFRLFSTKQQNL